MMPVERQPSMSNDMPITDYDTDQPPVVRILKQADTPSPSAVPGRLPDLGKRYMFRPLDLPQVPLAPKVPPYTQFKSLTKVPPNLFQVSLSQTMPIPLPEIATATQIAITQQATQPNSIYFQPDKIKNVPILQTHDKQKKHPKKISPVAQASKIILPILLAFGFPFGLYNLLALYNIDISHIMYFFVVVSLLTTAYFILVEALVALRIDHLSAEPVKPYPPASAIIAAYLPNEADTIVETVNAMLDNVAYPAPFQLILAYNTPHDLPVENTLREIAYRDRRLKLLRVENSTSKAENVNCALKEVTGEFVGVFDADHHPARNSFTRAWRWLSQGYDVVQGHCVVRNGDKTWIARLAAVDFEVIYALGHPGRTRMHDFGIFGGSNGYWRTDLLRQTGMHESMLTEDIDATLRVTRQGHKIAYDSLLVSRELAPETLKALWNQRMRWAQGWFQVSLKHLLFALASRHLSFRQKLGMVHLLFWREIYAWLSVQIVPIIAFQALHRNIDWFYPPFLLSSIFTVCIGPIQVLLAYFAAAPEIQRHKGWFISYAVLSLLFFTAWKNHIARVAHIKELLGEREWKVTPRKSN